jgi:hypothetical protein
METLKKHATGLLRYIGLFSEMPKPDPSIYSSWLRVPECHRCRTGSR